MNRWHALFVLAFGSFIAGAETPPPTGDAGYADAGNVFFRDDELTRITVTMDQMDLEAMLADPFSNVYRPCVVRIENSQVDETVLDVAIRPRGNTARNAIKKSWKIKFNEFVPGREVHGLEKLNLNGHQNDPSVVRGKLAWDVYNAFGVPSPRASMVRLVINDGSLVDDVYANVEQIDDEFLSAWFGDDTGNLYQCTYTGERADLRFVPPGDAPTYAALGNPTYELENDSGMDQHADLASFIAFIEDADDATFASEIVDRFSVDNFLRAMAVDCVNGHWDNMWYGANNYFLYVNPGSGVIEYIPYDLDNSYGIDFFSTNWATRPPESFGDGGFGWDFSSPFGGGAEPPLVRRIFEIGAYRDQYFRYIRELVGAVGAPEEPVATVYPDTEGDVFHSISEPHFDLLSVDLANDEENLLARVQVAGPIDVGGSTDQARIMFFFDTAPGGSTSNPWGREIITSTEADYFLGSWTDGGGGFLLYAWNGGGWDLLHGSFGSAGGIDQDLSQSDLGVVGYTVPLDRLGLSETDSFAFDVVTTNDRGVGFEPGLDHLSNPAQATPDYDTASVAGTYPTHTLTPYDGGVVGGVDGIFTLGPRETHIDALQAMLAPFAFEGSYAGGASDYGYTNADFLASFTQPASYSGGQPWAWGVKPYIEARTAYLRGATPKPAALPSVFVNEVIASNDSIIMDEAGQFEDFIELYNAGDAAVDLSGMWLSDDPGLPRKWQIPPGTMIGAGGFLLVWADNDPLDGPLHATFGLGSGGETVTLSHTDEQGAVLIDSLTYPGLLPDQSYGRFPDGSEMLEVFCAVTPAAPNDPDDACFTEPDPTPRVFVNEWLASNDGSALDEFGEDDDFFELYNDEDFTVDLGGRFLTDDLSDRTKWEIPEGVSIGPKSRLVFWADNEPEQGDLHVGFALSAGGEAVGLFDRASNQLAEIDSVTFGAQTADVAEGRSPDGSVCFGFFTPTPGAPNPAGVADLAAPIGVLDFSDVIAFLGAFGSMDPLADLAPPVGTFDFSDVIAFLAAFGAGCP
ncbi:MAG: CotH kinase family protein [Phycisphaerales bacterium JB059]